MNFNEKSSSQQPTWSGSFRREKVGDEEAIFFFAREGELLVIRAHQVLMRLYGSEGEVLLIPMEQKFAQSIADSLFHAMASLNSIPKPTNAVEVSERIRTAMNASAAVASNGYRYEMAGQFDKSFRGLAEKINSEEFRPLVKSFARNMERLVSMCAFPIELIDITRQGTVASHLTRRNLGVDFNNRIMDTTDRYQTEYHRVYKEQSEKSRSPEDANQSWQRGSKLINDVTTSLRSHAKSSESEEYFFSGVDALLSAMLTNAYQAFEILASDLWVASMNANNRAVISWVEKNPSKQTTFAQLFSGGLDLTGIMGSRLYQNGSVKFHSLHGIKEAYIHSYGAEIAPIFSDDALISVEKTRHLFAHRSGIVDAKFIDDVKNLPGFSGIEVGEEIRVDGPFVCKAVDACVKAGVSLIQHIDEFQSASAT